MADPLDSILADLSEDQLTSLEEAERGERLTTLAKLLAVTEDNLLETIGEATALPVIKDFALSEDPRDTVPIRIIHEFQCIPVRTDAAGASNEVELVTGWPPTEDMDGWVFAATGKWPLWRLGSAEKITETITGAYGVGASSLDDSDLDGFADTQTDEDEEDEDAALIRFVNEIITKAVADRATDIHFEPQRDALQIRYRIDGQLVPVRVPDNLVKFQKAIISRLKIMARLNISERRRPQDGRISFQLGKEDLDIRISSLPTMFGESVSLRLLSNKSQPVTIVDLGFLQSDIAMLEQTLERPHGIILATGPTGAGKSTTLSAFIRKIRSPSRRIVTIEDPVEYEIAGVNQTQVHADIGLTFAASLRSVLRQDPDVIMVGEIRDRETAEIAIRASLTGHLVLSTLHTNDAPGALTRLVDMDIEPFLIASSVEMVIAQRLVRRLCQHCAQPDNSDPAHIRSCLTALHVPHDAISTTDKMLMPVGCEMCRNLGYRGRVGLFEVLRISDEIHDQIIQRASAHDIRVIAEKQGMRTLQSSGWEQIRRGLTSLPEVMKYADLIAEIEEKANFEAGATE